MMVIFVLLKLFDWFVVEECLISVLSITTAHDPTKHIQPVLTSSQDSGQQYPFITLSCS